MNGKYKALIWIAVGLAVLLIVAIFFGIRQVSTLKGEADQARLQNEELKLENEQLGLTKEYDAVNAEFKLYEDQAVKLANDTILTKYNAAKAKIEQLLAELKAEKGKPHIDSGKLQEARKKIAALEGEVKTLKGLLRNYIAQIDSLSKENAGLRDAIAEVRTQNDELTTKVEAETQRAENLSQRMVLAEKLNVTGVSLQALKKNGKAEGNVTKAKQLMVSFTISQNNSTPVGNKTIYMRLTNPEGQLLGNGGSFAMDGSHVACSAKKTVEYSGDEISGIHMYWDVNTTLTPGDYTVELFTDGYRLCSRHFTLKK